MQLARLVMCLRRFRRAVQNCVVIVTFRSIVLQHFGYATYFIAVLKENVEFQQYLTTLTEKSAPK